MKKTNFWAQNFDKAAEHCRQICQEEVKATIAWANDICEQKYLFRGHWEMERTNVPVIFENEIGWDVVPAGDPEWVYAFNRLSIFVVLGKAWRYTADEKYVHAFVKQMSSWLLQVPFSKQATQTTWRSIETGIRCKNILLSISLMQNSGLLTDAFLKKIDKSLLQHAEWLVEANSTFQKISNWGVLQDHGLFILGAYFENDEWLQLAATRLNEELFYQVLADGTHWEQSPLYQCEVLQCCLDTILVAKRIGFLLPQEFLQRTLGMSQGLANLMRPDGLLVCQSDSDEVDARDVVAFAAVLFGNADLKAVADDCLYEENIWDFIDLAEEYYSLPTGKRPKSVVLPASGNTMLRGGDTAQDDFLHMHCGSLGSGHGHADLLHVDLVSHGQTILADTGRYTYVDGDLRKLLKSPAGHNTILVDGQWFTEYKDSWSYENIAEPLKGEYRLNNLADYSSGMHLGYRAQGVLPKREVLRLGKNTWVIWDTLFPFDENEHRYQHLFHFGIEGKAILSPSENTLSYISEKASADFVFCGERANLRLESSPISREYNLLEETSCLWADYVASGFAQFITVVQTGQGSVVSQVQAEIVPVSLQAAQKELPLHIATGLKITNKETEWTIINCHNEVIDQVDLFTANGYCGYGKKLVFNQQNRQGVCLAW